MPGGKETASGTASDRTVNISSSPAVAVPIDTPSGASTDVRWAQLYEDFKN